MSNHQSGRGNRSHHDNRGDYDDSFADQRDPQHGMGNRPRHWQGKDSGERGAYRDEPDFDRRSYGTGNQYGEAGAHARGQSQQQRRDGGFAPDDHGSDDFGRGNEKVRDERDEPGRHSGAHAGRPGQGLHSRSADPGQSSYGGFTNEDPSFQRQQLEHYEGGRAYPGYHHSAQGGQQVGSRSERQQHAYSGRPTMPKGYQRSDERLMDDVCERLSRRGLDVREVSVQVSAGTVSLEGSVADRRTKHAIEDCVDGVPGVQDVDNRIRIARDGGAAGSSRGE